MVSIENVEEKELKKVERYGYKKDEVKSSSEILRYKGESTLVLYKNKRLLVQGSKEKAEIALKLLNYLGIGSRQKYVRGTAIGTDECLKGDTFGGLVVAGFKADDSSRKILSELNVKDSKKMLNPKIVEIAREIMEKYPSDYHIESLNPKEFNKLNTRNNITQILDKMHLVCYKRLAGKSGAIHIVDLYPGCGTGHIRVKGAESRYIEVAAASVLARYAGLKQIRELEQKAGFFIPLGSSNVYSALLELKKKSLNPAEFVKMSFKNVKEIF